MTQLRNWIDEPCYMTQLRRQVHSQIGGDSTSSIKHRTSLTSHDHSQISEQTNSTYTKRSEEKRPFEDRSKTQEVEERRLRAVHAQTQSDAGGSYENHPKARHYMMQLRNQIDEPHPLTETQCEAGGPSGYCSTSKIKHRSPSSYEDLPLISNQTTSSREERRSSSQTPNESFESIERPVHEELTEDGASISNIYAAKLHQSHQRARELRLQLEQEEQRCAEFAKSVCELHSETSSISCRRTRSGRHQAEGTDRHLVSRSLDKDARRYFEESVAILKLENMDSESSFSDGPCLAHFSETNSFSLKRNAALRSSPGYFLQPQNVDNLLMDKEPETIKRRLVNADGVVMPWLDGEWDNDAIKSKRKIESKRKHENLKFQQDLRDLSIINEVPVFNSSSMPISGFKISEGKCFSNAADINPREFVQNYSNQDVDATEIFTSETNAYVTQVSPNNLQLQDGFEMHGQYIAIHDLEFMKTEKCSLFLKQATSICLERTIENVDCMEETASLLLLDAILSQRKLFRSRIAQGRMLLCGGKL